MRALNFYGAAPKKATREVYAGKDYSHGVLSVPAPSALKGYEALHKAYGRLAWAKVVQPAIELAENGFVIEQPLADDFRESEKELAKIPSTAKVFLPSGRAPKAGEIFRQSDLARTLREVAQYGADVFYHGPIGSALRSTFAQTAAFWARMTWRTIQAKWLTPISTTYRGYAVYTQPPSSSAIAVLEQLNILEGYDLKALSHSLRLLVVEKSHRWSILLSVSSRYHFSDTLRHSEVL